MGHLPLSVKLFESTPTHRRHGSGRISEQLDVLAYAVCDIDNAIASHCNVDWLGESAIATIVPPPSELELTSRAKFLNSLIGSNEHVSDTVSCDALRGNELARSMTSCTNSPDEVPYQVELLHTIIAMVYDIHATRCGC